MTTQQPTARHITYVPLDAVKPAVRNPKKHDIEAISHAIETVGFTDPAVIDERTQRLIDGHGRWEALVVLRAGGCDTPDGILVDDDGGWLIPLVRGWASKNDAEAEAAVILANRVQELGGGYQDRMLSAMLEDVHAADAYLFEVLRYSEDDMESLLKYSTDGSDLDGGATVMSVSDLANGDVDLKGDRKDDGELPNDAGVTELPAASNTGKTRCPSCGHHFTPGDREKSGQRKGGGQA